MNDYRIDPATGDYILEGTSLELCGDLGNRIYLALTTPLGSILGDADFGSKLNELRRAKALPDALQKAEDYARQALQFLLDDASARAVTVSGSWRPDRRGIDLAIEVNEPAGTATYTHFIPVG